MQALKALVIIMGVLIILGTTVVVVTIYNRLSSGVGAQRAAGETAAAPASAAPAAFGAVEIALPEGCGVVEMVPGGERLLLRLGGRAGCDGILVLDVNTGRQLGNLEFVTQP
ncbi:MAG: hypothetical protein BroJett029_11950 [Alphaproteobacteria bacterium]|nr:MAG: hypothetical protein BroJett029_11950 [Alphaproteobacteria bacterium]